jgi:hypothetical protein
MSQLAPMVDVPAACYVLVGVAIVLLVWSLIRRAKNKRAPVDELPRRRRPIDQDSREARGAQCDAVLAECARSRHYIAARLLPYEGEISHLAELCLELDESAAGADGEEGDHAWR